MCEFVRVFFCALVLCARGSEVMVELMENYVRVVEAIAVGDVYGFVLEDVAALMLGVSFWHAHFQLRQGHMIAFAEEFEGFFSFSAVDQVNHAGFEWGFVAFRMPCPCPHRLTLMLQLQLGNSGEE